MHKTISRRSKTAATAMHKTLTGKNMFEAMSAGEIFATPNPLSWAIFGRGMAGEDGSEAVSYAGADDVKAVTKAMRDTDIDALLANVDFADFGAAGTYPDIWGYESEFERPFEFLSKCRRKGAWRANRSSINSNLKKSQIWLETLIKSSSSSDFSVVNFRSKYMR